MYVGEALHSQLVLGEMRGAPKFTLTYTPRDGRLVETRYDITHAIKVSTQSKQINVNGKQVTIEHHAFQGKTAQGK